MQNFKRLIILSLFILLPLCPVQAIAGDYEEYQAIEHFNQGVKYHEQGRTDVAITQYKQAIVFNPNLSEAYYNLGLIYADKKQYTDAKIMFKKFAELEPYSFDAHFNLGIMYSETGAIESAISTLERAATLKPNAENVHLALGALYAKNDQETQAIAELRKAYRINPYNSDVKKVLDAYDQQTRSSTSASPTRSSTSSSSTADNVTGWIWLIVMVGIFGRKWILPIFNRILYGLRRWWEGFKNPVNRARRFIRNSKQFKETGSFHKSKESAKEALKILTSPETMLLNKHYKTGTISKPSELHELQIAACYLYAKSAFLSKGESIENILNEIKKVTSWDYSLLYLLGELAYIQKDFKKSFDYFTKLATSDKKNTLINLWLGILNYKLSNFDTSMQLLKLVNFPIQQGAIKEDYLLDNPNELSELYLRYRGLACYAVSDWNHVVECLEKIRKDYTLDTDLRFYLARAYLNMNKHSEALSVINEGIERGDDDSDLLVQRAKIYKRMKNLNEAAKDLKKALSISTDDHEVYRELAILCSLQNHFDDALVCFNKAIQIKPDDFLSHYKKGMLCEKNNIFDRAIEAYLSAVKIDENNPYPNTRIGISYCKQGRYHEALPYFEKALSLGDASKQVLYFSGLAYANTDNYNKGIARWEELSKKGVVTHYSIAQVDKNGRRIRSFGVNVPESQKAPFYDLLEDVKKLKELSVNREKYLFRELEQEVKQQNWNRVYDLLSDIRKTATDRAVVFNIFSYIRNKILPDFLRNHRRSELSEMLKSGLKENPTNYNLLHNVSVLYYWWTVSSERKNSKDIQDHKLWDNLIGYWTAIVNNDEFWEKWAKGKPWIKNKEELNLSKIRNSLMSHIETQILSSSEKDRLQNSDASLVSHRNYLKKLHIEKRFISYYKELKNILSDDVAALPDMCSETLIHDLDMRNYIVELSDLALQKDPNNEKINKIKYYLSPFRYIAVLLEDEDYEHAIKELEALPVQCKNDAIVCSLMNISRLKLGASYLQNDNISNHIGRTEMLWNRCQILNNELAISVIESAALDAMKKFKAEDKIDTAISAGELVLKFLPDNRGAKDFLSILFNERGVNKWNAGLTDFSVNGGIYDMEKALEFNCENARAKKNLSIMYSLLGWKYIRQKDRNNDSIPEMFNKALELDKDNEDAKKGFSIYWNDLGIACGNTDDKETATKCFILALQYAPLEKTIIGNLRRVSYSKYQEHINALKEYGIDLEQEDEE